MDMYRSSLTIGNDPSHQPHVVPVGTTLAEVIERIDLGGPPYVIVLHDDGIPAGIIAVEELLQRIAAADPIERHKWSSRPVETVLAVVFSGLDRPACTTSGPQPREDSTQSCTTLLRGEQLLAVATNDDVLVSWKFLRPVLARAERDTVTGLVSRSAFLRSFDCEIARARRGDKSLSVILIDIDRFKHVNDQAGHAMGDAVLSMVGAAILTSVRSYDVAARFAGDEFVAVCCECGPEQVHIPINRIQQAVALLPAPPSATVAPVTLSIGAATLERVGEEMSAELLLEAADECLYRAKRNGRDCAFAVDLSEGAAAAREPRLVEFQGTPAASPDAVVLHGWSGRRRT
jgi:diguanylate cyclase (GGDEF)-like protein